MRHNATAVGERAEGAEISCIIARFADVIWHRRSIAAVTVIAAVTLGLAPPASSAPVGAQTAFVRVN
jgi:hypothetical protein